MYTKLSCFSFSISKIRDMVIVLGFVFFFYFIDIDMLTRHVTVYNDADGFLWMRMR